MAEPLKVEFHFDFGSPNAYLAELVLPEIEQRTGVKFDYVPVLLGGVYKATGNMSPGKSLRGIKNKPEYNALETERFLRPPSHHQIAVESVLPGKHLMLMRGVVAAQFEGPVQAVFSRRLSSHVGRAEEDGRSADLSRRAPVLRASISTA